MICLAVTYPLKYSRMRCFLMTFLSFYLEDRVGNMDRPLWANSLCLKGASGTEPGFQCRVDQTNFRWALNKKVSRSLFKLILMTKWYTCAVFKWIWLLLAPLIFGYILVTLLCNQTDLPAVALHGTDLTVHLTIPKQTWSDKISQCSL